MIRESGRHDAPADVSGDGGVCGAEHYRLPGKPRAVMLSWLCL
jgi:hypothetical protein